MDDKEDLIDKLSDVYRGASKTLFSQAYLACVTIMAAPGAKEDIGPVQVKWATAQWYAEGLSPATITKRLNCLGKLGVPVAGLKPIKKPQLKWWLKPQMKAALMAHTDISRDLKDWVEWTTTTGLRIEESLRLISSDFIWSPMGLPEAITVPGLKTHASQTTLPLGECSAEIAERRLGSLPMNQHLFGMSYMDLVLMWDNAMILLGVDKKLDPTATLKALRRNAARYLHVDRKMPLDMVRQYLRHEDIQTTMGYLALTGGYGTEEMKGYL